MEVKYERFNEKDKSRKDKGEDEDEKRIITSGNDGISNLFDFG